MALRTLTAADADTVELFVLLASFPPGAIPEGATEHEHVRRWLTGRPDAGAIAIGDEQDGHLVGAALARVVEPVRLLDDSGEPVPEVLVAVRETQRGRGIGTRLIAGLIEAASAIGWPALSLTVSERNSSAVAMYQRAGFTEAHHADGLLVMGLTLDRADSAALDSGQS